MTSGPFFEQFIDDYYAECDEHLAVVRRALLALEERGPALEDVGVRHGLSRSLHTLKGLSGMVSLSTAERVAHAMEEWLRAYGESPRGAPRALEALFDGVRLLERCIGARRSGEAQPDVDGYLADAAAALHAAELAMSPDGDPPSPDGPPTGDAPSPTGLATYEEAVVYRFEFAPSHELAARGVGVETVRTRLQELGTLLAARPRVVSGSGIVFEFVVAVPAGLAPDERWRADRISWVAEGRVASRSVELATLPPSRISGAAAPHALDEPAVATDLSAEPSLPIEPRGLPLTAPNTVRVDLARLDDVMRMVGELVISRSRLDESLRHAADDGGANAAEILRETNAAMERQLRALREGVMRIRLVPIGEMFERLRFAVRDIARELRKPIAFHVAGQSTEIDKLVVDRMLEPLLHLVRNAVSHGIESPEERRALGKPAEGRLSLRAVASGDRIIIEVEDDGAGIDIERVSARAREQGLLLPAEAKEGDGLDGEALLDVLCAQGFSTRAEADLASGRGTGMAVVRATIRALGGQLSIATERGRGTRFIAQLPLTLMIVDALLVEIGPHQMAVPQPALREILRVDASELTRFEANAVISYRGGVLPLLSTRRLFGIADPEGNPLYVLVVGSDAHPLGLVVDRVVGLREIVVHTVTDPLVAVPGISGATELGDGRVCLIIDAGALSDLALERRNVRVTPTRVRAALAGAGGPL